MRVSHFGTHCYTQRPAGKTRNTFCRTRSLSNATFSFLITCRSPVQNLLLCTKFHENRMIFHWDITINRFSKWRPSAILELFYHHTRPPTKSVAGRSCLSNFINLIHRSDHLKIGYSYLNFSHIWLEMPTQAPKILNVIIHHRNPPKGTSLRKSASFKLSTVKIRWGVWPVGELTESVTGTHTDTHTGKFIFCPCITLDRQKLCNGRWCDTVVKGHRNCYQSKACMRFPISLFYCN